MTEDVVEKLLKLVGVDIQGTSVERSDYLSSAVIAQPFLHKTRKELEDDEDIAERWDGLMKAADIGHESW